MKTKFETPEEQAFLRKLLHIGSMHTEKIFDPFYISMTPDYVLALFEFRRKIFEYLEESDPNQPHVDACLKQLGSALKKS